VSNRHTGNTIPALEQEEHEHSLEPATKKVLIYGFDGSAKQIVKTNSDGELGVNLNGIVTPLSSTVTVTTSATALPVSSLVNRKSIVMWNSNSSLTAYIGASGLASGTGIQLNPEEKMSIDSQAGLYAIAEANNILIRILELA